jgi:ABC-2 type transport system permease protein
MVSNPAFLIPSILMPVFFFSAFAGGLSAISAAPNFDYPDYSTFQYVFVLIQSAMFGGVFAGFAVAADFETGFSRRMMLATRSRSALIVGYALAALVRATIVWVIVTVLALATGASISPSPAEVLGIILLITLVNIAALLFAAGMAMRMRTMQAAPLIQLPAFLIIFTAPVYVPRGLLEGWVGSVADFNPVTAVLEAGRELIIGAPAEMLLAFGAAAGLMALTAVWAVTGLRRAERAAA